MKRILVPPRTCAVTASTPSSGVLIDGSDYYRELYRAACNARRSILITGWQFDSHVELLRGDEAETAPYPTELVPFLVALCTARPELEVHVLAWNASAVFVFERQPLQAWAFNRAHERIHYRLDAVHPVGASHHQKMVVIDRAVAFLGGMDLCDSRWDDHCHRDGDPRRRTGIGRTYGPYHEVQAYVTGAAVDVLRDWFVERWQRATGEALTLPEVAAARITIAPSVAITVHEVGLARTQPPMKTPRVAAIRETLALYRTAILAAEQLIYLENQYYTAESVHRALLERLRRPRRPPLDVIFVLPEKPEALKERIALGIRQNMLLRELILAARAGGHRLGLYSTVDCEAGATSVDDEARADVPVYIHSKLLAVDDRFLLIGSANTTNRSMGLDTEVGVAWESQRAEASLRALRMTLLAEHTGLTGVEAEMLLRDPVELVTRLEQLIAERRGRLRRIKIDDHTVIDRLLPADVALDPNGPIVDEAFSHVAEGDDRPAHWLDRMATVWRHLRSGLARPES